MSSVAERMAARLATTPESEHGARCFSCRWTALACAHRFVVLDEHCCEACRCNGARVNHSDLLPSVS